MTIDRTAPTVSSINRTDASPTSGGPLHWTVAFSEPVSNVGTGNFGLVLSGISGSAPVIASAVAVGAAPAAAWTVTVATAGTTGTNSGSIGLNLTAKGTIRDGAGNLLGGSVPVVGQVYAYDTTAPATPSITDGPPLLPNWTTTTDASFSFTGDAGATFLCSLNSSAAGDFTACTSATSYSGVAEGLNTFYVKSRDTAGNLSAFVSRQWQVDTTGSIEDFTVTGSAIGLLYPGGPARPIAVTLHNPNDVPIYVTALTVAATTSTPAGCDHDDLVLVQADLTSATPNLYPDTIVVPANGSVTLPDQNVAAPTIRLENRNFDQTPTCAGQTFSLTYSGSAHS